MPLSDYAAKGGLLKSLFKRAGYQTTRTAGFVAAGQYSKGKNDIQSQLEKDAWELNRTLPMSVSPELQWDSISVGAGKTVTFKYTWLNYTSDPLNPITLDAVAIKRSKCADPATMKGLKSGVRQRLVFRDKYQRNIGSVTVSAADCY